ncbi:TonB-dependent receptor [Chitinophaga arvensicola]|nr:TonB-dependent receptor [Chitinophaga arvensicola]
MKLVTFLTFTAVVQLHAAGYGQRVSLHLDHAPLKKVFREIRKQTGYDFFYSAPLLQQARAVNIQADNEPLESVLRRCFASQPFTWVLEEKTVIVKPQTLTDIRHQTADKEIKGIVTNAARQPLIGVSVRVKGGSTAAITDQDGHYHLRVNDSESILIFSCIGFLSKEIPAGNNAQLDIVLEPDEKGLSEVVVVGYGTQKKSDVTAAITTVNLQDIKNSPQPNVLSMLQGRVPGLTITQSSSEPGKAPEILVRGVGTIDGATSPLVLIDGVPGGNLALIPPSDIESFSVLKDAAAAAIYGARAANGVILVTTRKGGGQEKVSLEFNSYVGLQSPTKTPETIDSYQYATLVNEAASNEGRPAVYTPKDMELFKNGGDNDMHANTKWIDLILQKQAPIITNYLSAGGDSKLGRYFLSGEYMYQKGAVKDIDNYRRANIRANITSQLSKKLQLQLLTGYTRSSRDATDGMDGIFSSTLRASATSPVRFSDGHWGGQMFANDKYLWSTFNPVSRIAQFGPQSHITTNANINASLEYKPIQGLTLKALGSYMAATVDESVYNQRSESWDFLTKSISQTIPSSLNNYWYKDNKYDVQLTATYERNFNDHQVKLLAGYSQESWRSDKISGYRKDFITDNLYQLNAGDAASQENTGEADQWAFMSGFGRLNYSYKGKYLVEASMRYDGSSRLAPGHQWGLFPSVSAGWNLEKENFLRGWQALDLLKIRASAGRLGNAEKLGLYDWFPGITSGAYYNFNDQQVVGTKLGSPANTNLTWETTTTYNAGIDASFLNGMISFSGDVWSKRTDDILLGVPVSTIVGIAGSRITANAGKVGSHGFDFQITHHRRIGKDLQFDISFNAGSWRSWVIDLKDRATPYSTEFRPGEDLGNIYGYEAVGIINSEDQLNKYKEKQGVVPQVGMGDLEYKDQNGDGRIDYMDAVKIGNNYVKLQYGLNLSLQYKGFDFSAFFQGAGNTDRSIGSYIKSTLVNYSSPLAIHMDRWTPENHNANAMFPRLLQNFNQNQSVSSWWIRNGAYVRLKNLQIGYNLPKNLMNQWKINSLRVYVAGSNLLTWAPDAIKGFDPERDISDSWYPTFRVFSFGVNLKF